MGPEYDVGLCGLNRMSGPGLTSNVGSAMLHPRGPVLSGTLFCATTIASASEITPHTVIFAPRLTPYDFAHDVMRAAYPHRQWT